VITLVHGTYAKHGDWIQDYQTLTGRLVSKIGGTVLDRFCWSGKNRHTSRLEAGDDLRKHLVELISLYRDADMAVDHHVIAHSHGGNVALYALRDRQDEDDAILADVKVITLATPFLFMRERLLPRWLFLVLPLFLGLSTLTIGVGGIFTILLFVFFLIGFAAFPLSLGLYWAGRSSASLKIRDLITCNAARDEAEVITASHMEPPDRLYIIRGMGDEATGGLAAAQLTNWVMARLLAAYGNWMGVLVRTVIGGIALALIFSIFSLTFNFFLSAICSIPVDAVQPTGFCGMQIDTDFIPKLDEDFIPTIIAFAVRCGMVVAVIAVIALPLIAIFVALSNLPFGLDSLFWNYHAQSTAESSPLGTSEVVVVGKHQFNYGALSHGVYEDKDAIKAIVAHIGCE
jgi:hypothetical protein